MAKARKVFICTDCGEDFQKWQGQCPNCKAWNTVNEVSLGRPDAGGGGAAAASARLAGYAGERSEVQLLKDIKADEYPRISTGMREFDRVLGGGLVPGSAILIGGHPGAGKSTLLLQTVCHLAESTAALYVTGEESLHQIAMRAQRLKLDTDHLKLQAETNVHQILNAIEVNKPQLVVVDSVQATYVPDVSSAPGGVAQVRESAAFLIQAAKRLGFVLFLVGHVTKDGSLAGPKVLEHMIDSSILLEGSHDSRFRTLRGQKNRFGAVNELGVFAMTEQGLKEVKNPSAIFLSGEAENTPGTVVMVVWEGTRPILVEIQALVDDSQLGSPRRVAVGLDQNRLSLLLAVLHRHGGLLIGGQDVFVNVVGGVKVLETSADLALLLALVSSFRDTTLPKGLVVFGEVGLGGEIRPVPSGQERLNEAAKHGFTQAIVPKANAPKAAIPGMKVVAVERLSEALAALE